MVKEIVLIGGDGLVGHNFKSSHGGAYEIIDLSYPRVDIRDRSSLQQALLPYRNCLGIVNLAAATDTAKAFSDTAYQEYCWQVNAQGALNVAQVCQDLDTRLIHVSTDYVYPGTQSTPYLETDPLDPIEPYGASKAAGEVGALEFGAVVATLAFPYGPALHPTRPDSVAKIITQLKKGNRISAFSDQYVCPTFLPDFTSGLVALLENRDLVGKFHIVGPPQTPYSMRCHLADVLDLSTINIIPTSVTEYNRGAMLRGDRTFHPNLTLSTQKARSVKCEVRSFENGVRQLNLAAY
ncbi:MAG: sugar nucleotide-binding protein [Candidatus Shapirobacteria bacterium]